MVKYSMYFGMATDDLMKLRLRKMWEIKKLNRLAKGHWRDQDIRRLTAQIDSIDAVLKSRRDQLDLGI